MNVVTIKRVLKDYYNSARALMFLATILLLLFTLGTMSVFTLLIQGIIYHEWLQISQIIFTISLLLIFVYYIYFSAIRVVNYRMFTYMQLKFYRTFLFDTNSVNKKKTSLSSKLILHLTDDILAIREFADLFVRITLCDFPLLLMVISVMIYYNPYYAALFVATIFLFFPLIDLGLKKMAVKTFDAQEILSSYINRFDDVLRFISSVKALHTEFYELSVSRQLFDKLLSLYARSIKSEIIAMLVKSLFYYFVFLGAWFFLLHQVHSAKILMNEFIILLLTSVLLPFQFHYIYRKRYDIEDGLNAADKVYSLLREECADNSTEKKDLIHSVRYGIKFSNVSYSDQESEVLSNLDIEISHGSVIGILGCNASEKAAMISLLFSFCRPASGRLTIDGIDVSSIANILDSVCLVSKDTFLFDGSIRENIMYGSVSATKSDIINAAKLANIHDFIMECPDKYSTIIGRNGLKLANHEKCRLAIARAFLKNPNVLILDDVSHPPESEAEYVLNSALDLLMRGRTVIVITNSFYGVVHAANIYVMLDGKIAEQGTHKQLMRVGGVYANLYERGIADFEELH